MSSLFGLLLALYYSCGLSYSQDHNDTLLSCFICMELEYAPVKQKCDENKPMFQTCVFTKDLINWKDVDTQLDSQVTFKCLLLYYKDVSSTEVKSLRGCVAEYGDYHVCDHLQKIVSYEEEISCILCDTRNCNSGMTVEENSAHINNNSLHMILFILLFSISLYL